MADRRAVLAHLVPTKVQDVSVWDVLYKVGKELEGGGRSVCRHHVTGPLFNTTMSQLNLSHIYTVILTYLFTHLMVVSGHTQELFTSYSTGLFRDWRKLE